ncbi:MAG: hypothetical protein NC453_31120 [Muribaculum sp.]|nr:hypothetical protein [Muribaculum sp.]
MSFPFPHLSSKEKFKGTFLYEVSFKIMHRFDSEVVTMDMMSRFFKKMFNLELTESQYKRIFETKVTVRNNDGGIEY